MTTGRGLSPTLPRCGEGRYSNTNIKTPSTTTTSPHQERNTWLTNIVSKEYSGQLIVRGKERTEAGDDVVVAGGWAGEELTSLPLLTAHTQLTI